MNTKEQKRAEEKFNKYQTKDIKPSDIEKAEKKASKLGEQMGNFKLLLSMLKDSFAGKFHIDGWAKAIIIGAIIYVISPIDAIPDFIPVVGWVDDIGIVGLAMKKLNDVINTYKSTIS